MKEKYMREAIKESEKALKTKNIPVGCVIVFEDKIIGRGHNAKEDIKDATMHAEIIALKKAYKKVKDWRLNKCSVYITMEPCYMCLGAIIESRIENVYCGIKNNVYHKLNSKIVKLHNINMKIGIFEDEIIKNTKYFFNLIRNR